MIRSCAYCGGPFPKEKPSHSARRIYCSSECVYRHREKMALERLTQQINITSNGCHEYTGARFGGQKYGRIQYKNKVWPAHRLVWSLLHGRIPESMVICHKCDNPPCINPEHLFIGTPSDNMLDMANKGRGRIASGSRIVIGIPCSKGHLPEHRVKDAAGKLRCRMCHREAAKRWREARR